MDDYMQKIQSMGFDNASMIALSGNKDFDRVYNDRQKGYIPRAVYFNGRAVSPDRFSYDRKGGRAGALGGFNINPDRPSSKGVGGQMRQSASQMLREAQQQRFGTLTKYEHTNVSAKDKQSNGTVLKNISKEDLKNAENSDEGQRLNALLEGFREGVRIESPKKVWQENKVVLDAIEAIEKNGFLDEETYNKLTEDQRKEVGEAVEHAKTMTKEEQEALKEKNKERKEVENKLEDLKKRHKEKNPNDENCLECAPYEEKAVELQEDEKVLRGIKRKSGTKKNNSKNKNKK
jgi:hypothetical protein